MIYMSKEADFYNPTPAEKERVEAIKRADGKLPLQDEHFLRELWRRCEYVPAMDALIVRLAPLLHHYVQQEINAKGIKNDIAYEDKPRADRPLGTSFELLSEVVSGVETMTDRELGLLTARGFMGAIPNHNPNRGRLGTYVRKEITGVVADWNVRELRRGEAGAPDGAAASAEFLAQFRTDVEGFLTREAVDACVRSGVFERPPERKHSYVAFVDPSGGSSDAMTLAIAHTLKSSTLCGSANHHSRLRPWSRSTPT
jgi:hypothetical protein